MDHLRNARIALAVTATLAIFAKPGFAVESPANLIGFPSLNGVDQPLSRITQAWDALRESESVQTFLQNSRHSFKFARHIKSKGLESVKFQHYYGGLEVVGSMAIHQTSSNGSEILNRVAEINLNTTPRLDEQVAVEIARSLVGDRPLSTEPTLKIIPEAEGGGGRLVYWIELEAFGNDGARDIVLDANSGEVIGNVSKNIAIAPVNVFSAQNLGTEIIENAQQDPSTGRPTLASCTIKNISTGQSQDIPAQKCQTLQLSDLPPNQCQIVMNGSPLNITPQNCTPEVRSNSVVGSDPAAMRAFKNSQIVLDYYLTHHGRNSFDNQGSAPVNIVHGGLGWDNAFWRMDLNVMVYGDGDGKVFGDFTQALDVAGHEQTHGVVEYTAKLLGMGESGALNEAFADFFGKMIANDGDWAIGRKIFVDQAHAPGVRNLANPALLSFCAAVGPDGRCSQKRPYPSTLAQKMTTTGTCDMTNDNCWVHVNSTIPSHASYLVAQALGNQKAEQLYYAALSHSLTSRDNIVTAARAIKAICPKVLDAGSCSTVNQAYAQVGL